MHCDNSLMCVYKATKRDGIYSCSRCGHTTAYTPYAPVRVFRRCTGSLGKRRLKPWLPTIPVGNITTALIAEIAGKRECQQCDWWRRKMNAWGLSGCLSHRAMIWARIKDQAKESGFRLTSINAVYYVSLACAKITARMARRYLVPIK